MTSARTLIANRYRLDVALASGGMGVVWKGWDERLERPVAIKQVRLQPGLSALETAAARDRALREARLTARLHHPHAVPIYDVVEHEGEPCLIMQFLPSVSLQATLERRRTLPAVEVARIGNEIAAALTAAHRVGIVHRDVKPGNVLLAEDGSAKLTDFGISHALGDVNLTATGMLTGTPAYLAPEVARGQSATFASDVFSLGSTLYAATEGTPPFEQDANAMAVLHRVASGQFRPPSRSGPLTPLLLRMLHSDPNARPTMTEVSSALTKLHEDLATTGSTAAPAESPTARLRQRQPPTSQPTAASRAPAITRAVDANPDSSNRRRALLIVGAIAVAAVVAVALVFAVPRIRDGSGTVLASGQDSTAPANTGRARLPSKAAPAVGRSKAAPTVGRSTTAPTTPKSTTAPTTPKSTTASTAPQPTATTAPQPTAATAPQPTVTTRLASTSRPTSPRSTSATTSAATSATSTPTVSPSSGPTSARAAADRLARTVSDYYALMPTNLQQGWTRLTPSYQSGHAGGYQAYQQFWAQVSSVSIANVVGGPPNSARATITYYYKDGRKYVEPTEFGFVDSGGQLLINSSQVLGNPQG